MANLTQATDAGIDITNLNVAAQIPDLLAGEAITYAAPCYVKSDGKVWMSNGTAANAAAVVRGWACRAAAAGQPVTVAIGAGIRFREAASGLTPGATYYVATTGGLLSDTATTGDAVGVAFALNATDIMTTR